MQTERQAGGGVSLRVWNAYFKAGSTFVGLSFMVFVMLLLQIVCSGSDYFVNIWTQQEYLRSINETTFLTTYEYLDIYGALIVGVVIVGIVKKRSVLQRPMFLDGNQGFWLPNLQPHTDLKRKKNSTVVLATISSHDFIYAIEHKENYNEHYTTVYVLHVFPLSNSDRELESQLNHEFSKQWSNEYLQEMTGIHLLTRRHACDIVSRDKFISRNLQLEQNFNAVKSTCLTITAIVLMPHTPP
ncbi:hypothetical protein GQX74_013498 [Glossina fuscipes]|nr:hypothetical protein GQX74_013498 [Glossina fuscipes]